MPVNSTTRNRQSGKMELVARSRIKRLIMRYWMFKGACYSAALLLTACAGSPSLPTTIPPLLNQPSFSVEDVDLLAVSESMRKFAEEYAPADLTKHRRAWNLSYSMLDSYIMPFDYDATMTLSASEAFRLKTGNCLSFSVMFIAMARSAGLKAWFQEVKVPPNWNNIDETYLVSKHLNAVVESRDSNFVVDVSGTRRSEWLDTKQISDTEAFAQYYNNLGAEALVDKDLPAAYAYIQKALEIDPKASYVWSNLGVVYNRNGQIEDAKAAYLKALSINSRELTALNNLHRLYFDSGDLAKADETSRRVEKYQAKNPWYKYQLSSEAVDEQRYTDAVVLLQDAIRLNSKEYRFHYALAQAFLLVGDNQAAQESIELARQLAPTSSDARRIETNQLLFNVDGL